MEVVPLTPLTMDNDRPYNPMMIYIIVPDGVSKEMAVTKPGALERLMHTLQKAPAQFERALVVFTLFMHEHVQFIAFGKDAKKKITSYSCVGFEVFTEEEFKANKQDLKVFSNKLTLQDKTEVPYVFAKIFRNAFPNEKRYDMLAERIKSRIKETYMESYNHDLLVQLAGQPRHRYYIGWLFSPWGFWCFFCPLIPFLLTLFDCRLHSNRRHFKASAQYELSFMLRYCSSLYFLWGLWNALKVNAGDLWMQYLFIPFAASVVFMLYQNAHGGIFRTFETVCIKFYKKDGHRWVDTVDMNGKPNSEQYKRPDSVEPFKKLEF